MGSGAAKHERPPEEDHLQQSVADGTRDVNATDDTGTTLLHTAAIAGDVEAVRFLMEHGAQSIRDHSGMVPLWHALQHRDPDLRERLSAHMEPHASVLLCEVEAEVQAYLRTGHSNGKILSKSDETEGPGKAESPEDAAVRFLRRTDGRKVGWIKKGAKPEGLVHWMRRLPDVTPSLGYTTEHVRHMEAGFRMVCHRLLNDIGKMRSGGARVEDWMAASDPFELLLSGYLFTSDCVEYVLDAEGAVVRDAKGKPEVAIGSGGKLRYFQLMDKKVLGHHGSAASSQSLALYSTMNRAMRAVSQLDQVKLWQGTAPPNVFELEPPPPQLHVIETFQPLIRGLGRLVASRRKQLRTVFRGIDVNVSAKYTIGTQLVWNCFTSTTLKREVATKFMYGKGGTFFVVVAKAGAADIKFSSIFAHEDELLYTANIEYRVQWKLSPTLLRMMGLRFDVIVMQELAAEGVRAEEQVRALQEVMGHMFAFFSDYLAQYIEGRVGDDPRVSEDDARPLMREVREWLALTCSQPRRRSNPTQRRASFIEPTQRNEAFCLIGEGGSGKTSASIAILSELAADANDIVPGDTPLKPYFPVFVSLPSVKQRLLEREGFDNFILDSFGLREEDRAFLGETYHVVVVLDSLDEVGLTRREVAVMVREGGLLARHPWVEAHCSVVVTVRGEYLKSVQAAPSAICGYSRVVYMQPFTEVDAHNYITRGTLAWERSGGGGVFVDEEDIPGLVALRNPFLLHMACHAKCSGDAEEADIYEAYLRKCTRTEMSNECGSDTVTEELVEEILRAGELVACRMLEKNNWHGFVSGASVRLEKHKVPERVRDLCFRYLPFRIEDFGELNSPFTFRHKSLGEHLAARRLARSPEETLLLVVRRCFSKESQRVLDFFASLTQQKGETYSSVHGELRALLSEKSDGAVSNALALLARARMPLTKMDLNGIKVQNCDLRGAFFAHTSLQGATFVDCWMEHAEFHTCNMADAVFTDCSLGTPLPPLLHPHIVRAVAVTPNGQHIATCCDDHSLRVFEMSTGKCTRTLQGHTRALTGVAVSPSGSHITTCSDDTTAIVWEFATGDRTWILQGHSKSVLGVAYSYDGSRLVTCSDDETLCVWSTSTGEAACILRGHTSVIFGVAFAPDGSVVSCSADDTVRIWNTLEGTVRLTLQHGSSVKGVAVSPDGAHIVSCTYNREVCLWDAETGRELFCLEGHTKGVTGVAVSHDGTQIISCSSDETVRVWEMATGKETLTLEGHSRGILGISVSAMHVVSCSEDKTVRVWGTSAGQETLLLDGPTSRVNSVAVGPDCKTLFSCAEDGTVCASSLHTGGTLRTLEGHTSSVMGVAVHETGNEVASASVDKTVRLWDTSTWKETASLPQPYVASGVALQGSLLATCTGEGTAQLSCSDRNEEIALEGHSRSVTGITINASGRKVATCSADKTVRIWDVSNGKELCLCAGHAKDVTGVTFTTKGRLVSCSYDKTIRIWDEVSGSCLHTFEGHSAAVKGVAASPDGVYVVSCSYDMTVKLWEARTGNNVLTLAVHSSVVSGVAVQASGPGAFCIASCSHDKTVRAWDVTTSGEELECVARNVFGRNSTVPRAYTCSGAASVTPEVARGILFGSGVE